MVRQVPMALELVFRSACKSKMYSPGGFLASDSNRSNTVVPGTGVFQSLTAGSLELEVLEVDTIELSGNSSELVEVQGQPFVVANANGDLAVGLPAGEGILAAGYTGSNNTGFGDGVLNNVTSGDNNTFVGTNAGRDTIGGSKNVFIGSGSGATNLYGLQNVCIGAQPSSAPAVPNATQSVSIGFGAQATSSYGVAIGFGASATQLNSMAIGNGSGCTTNSGVAIGPSSSVTGNSALAVGAASSAAETVSVALGASAAVAAGGLQGIACGFKSTVSAAAPYGIAIGSGASVTAGGIPNGVPVIAIGNNASVQSGGDGCIVIGANSFADGQAQIVLGNGVSGSVGLANSIVLNGNGVTYTPPGLQLAGTTAPTSPLPAGVIGIPVNILFNGAYFGGHIPVYT